MSAAAHFASTATLLRTRKLRKVSMLGDGNCFYRAVATAYYKDLSMHSTLRLFTMEHMLENAATYEPYFDSFAAMKRRLTANKRLGVWNSDLADLVPAAVASLLGCTLDVYAVGEDTEVVRYRFGTGGETIRLLYQDNHYDLLLKN